jgi:hypothetical protein
MHPDLWNRYFYSQFWRQRYSAQVSDFWNCGGLATTSPVDVSVSTTGSSGTPSLASGTPANASGAVFGIIAANRPVRDTFTVDTAHGWSSSAPTNHTGTTGGSSTSNIEIGTEVQIASATTSVTAAPTITSRQWGEIVISFSRRLFQWSSSASSTSTKPSRAQAIGKDHSWLVSFFKMARCRPRRLLPRS